VDSQEQRALASAAAQHRPYGTSKVPVTSQLPEKSPTSIPGNAAPSSSGTSSSGTPPSPDYPTREKERLREEIRTLVENVAKPGATESPAQPSSETVAALQARLQRAEFPVTLAHAVAERACRLAPDLKLSRLEAASRAALEGLRFSGGIRMRPGRATRVLFMGPAGSGKTSSLQKLATQAGLSGGKKVGILNTDTRRMGAKEQWTVFARTLGFPLAHIFSPEEVKDALYRMRHCDIILCDTTGLTSAPGQTEALAALSTAFDPDETHLILNATGRLREMERLEAAAQPLRPTHLLFTHLDESLSLGCLCSVAQRFSGALSYLGIGSDVPDGLLNAKRESLAPLLLRSLTDEGNEREDSPQDLVGGAGRGAF
jgi:flagellar biosynthesis protein FlhF